MKKVLVVEDEVRIAQIARDYLAAAGFGVTVAGDGKTALAIVRSEHPDLIVLDLGLPEMNGLDVTATLRKSRSSYANTPIIMLTARGEESDKLVGLELGADDYIVKPFSAKELVARVRAVLRRSELLPNDYQRAIVLDDIVIDPQKFRVVRKDQPIDVTYTEFQLLSTLAQQPGRIFTRAQLLDAIRGVELESYERIIDSHIKNLRRKLEPDPREPRYILSVYGVGYKFAEPISS